MQYRTIYSAIALLTLCGGCSSFSDFAITARNQSVAYKAWKGARWAYFDQGVSYRMREHIGRGFQQGYIDVANGGNGDLPLFPPGYYWGPEYQNAQGNESIAAWFRGYRDGAEAAKQAGIAGYHSLPTSWAPPYANDPDSPDGGYSPYVPHNTLQNQAPEEGLPRSVLEELPNLPAPPNPQPKPPVPMPKSVNVPTPPGLQPQTAVELQPTAVAPVEAVAPALSAPQLDAKPQPTAPATSPTPITPPNDQSQPNGGTPSAKTPAGRQTYLPPGSPKPQLTPAASSSPKTAALPKVESLPELKAATK